VFFPLFDTGTRLNLGEHKIVNIKGNQGRPINVKHGQSRGEQKGKKQGEGRFKFIRTTSIYYSAKC